MAKISYNKTSFTVQQQIELLKSRGLAIPHTSEAERYLRYHNYYQISGYIYYFEFKSSTRTHCLAQAISFDDIVALIQFDKNLRESFFSATSYIEMAIRCSVSYQLSQSYGPFCFQKHEIFRDSSKAKDFKKYLDKALLSHKNEPFISHHTNTYKEPIPPAWIMVEILSFGNISWLYSHLQTGLQKKIASDFNVHRSILVSWLKALTELRNTCAHHFRLWNKVFVNYPKIRKTDKSFPIIEGMESSLGSFLPMVGHLLHVVDERIDWKSEFLHLINTMPLIQPKDMGLHSWPNWEIKK